MNLATLKPYTALLASTTVGGRLDILRALLQDLRAHPETRGEADACIDALAARRSSGPSPVGDASMGLSVDDALVFGGLLERCLACDLPDDLRAEIEAAL